MSSSQVHQAADPLFCDALVSASTGVQRSFVFSGPRCAGNTLKHMYVTEKCIGSSGISVYGIDYQGGKQPTFHFELSDNILDDTEGMRVVGEDVNNQTISMGHGSACSQLATLGCSNMQRSTWCSTCSVPVAPVVFCSCC